MFEVYFSNAAVPLSHNIEVDNNGQTVKENKWFEKGTTYKLLDTEWNRNIIQRERMQFHYLGRYENTLKKEGIEYEVKVCDYCPAKPKVIIFNPFKIK